jgi:hypothetical protein
MQAFGSEGYVDFYIPDPYRECFQGLVLFGGRWGMWLIMLMSLHPSDIAMEIIRDGIDINKHLERFTNPGIYKPLLDCGAVEQWAVVDFRCPRLGPPRTRHPNLISVVFTHAFERAHVSRNGQLLQEVVLQGVSCEASLRAALMSVPQRPGSS